MSQPQETDYETVLHAYSRTTRNKVPRPAYCYTSEVDHALESEVSSGEKLRHIVVDFKI